MTCGYGQFPVTPDFVARNRTHEGTLHARKESNLQPRRLDGPSRDLGRPASANWQPPRGTPPRATQRPAQRSVPDLLPMEGIGSGRRLGGRRPVMRKDSQDYNYRAPAHRRRRGLPHPSSSPCYVRARSRRLDNQKTSEGRPVLTPANALEQGLRLARDADTLIENGSRGSLPRRRRWTGREASYLADTGSTRGLM